MKLRVALLVSGASGFLALSYEILWFRVFAFASQGAALAFGVLLGFYLIGTALGSFRSRVYCEAHGADGSTGTARRALGRALLLSTVVAFLVAPAAAWFATVGPWALGLLVVTLATALMGAVIPLTSHLAIAPDDRAGARLSYLYLANIIGSCLGSLLTGFVAMDVATTRQIAVGLAWLGFALSAAVTVALEPAGRPRAQTLVATGALALVVTLASHGAFDQLFERLLYRRSFTSAMHFAETVENRSGVINVSAEGKVFGGGVYDGAFNTSLVHDQNIIVRAYAVSLLHPRPKRMLMIGLATGSWAKVLAAAPGLERFTIVEINPGYLGLIAQHAEVAGILTDPKVEIVIDDGRRWLESHPLESFDAVVMNTTWHWRAHSTNLLSREFFELVRRHLNPGGLFFYNTTSSRDACETAIATFPHTYRISNFIAGSDAPLTFEREPWRALLESYRIDGRLVLDPSDEASRQTLDALLAFGQQAPAGDVEEEVHLARTCSVGEVITDDNMLPEWRQVLHWERP